MYAVPTEIKGVGVTRWVFVEMFAASGVQDGG